MKHRSLRMNFKVFFHTFNVFCCFLCCSLVLGGMLGVFLEVIPAETNTIQEAKTLQYMLMFFSACHFKKWVNPLLGA